MTRRKRVLHVLKVFRPDFSGEGIFFERCSAMMNALDPSVEHDMLVAVTPEPAQPPPAIGIIARLIYLSRSSLGSGARSLALAWWFLRHLHRYDVVHFRTHSDWYFVTYLLAKLAGRRLVLSATLDDSVPGLVGLYRPSRRPIVRRLFGLFDAFVSVSPKLQAETESVMPPERCHLIEYGIHFPRSDQARGAALRQRLGIPGDALVLVFVGGLCDRKDPMLLLRNHAALLQRSPGCHLLLVGPELEPDYVAAMHRLVETEGIAPHVSFIGEVTNPHLYFEASDIMVFASKLEGFGMVVPEAMGHALPPVVRHLPGVNDSFVHDGETGFFFNDDAGYRAAVCRLIDDPALRRRVGAAARAFVRAKYDMARVAKQYLHVYGLGPAPEPAEPPIGEALAELSAPVVAASLLDPRLQEPLPPPPRAERPRLIVLADAEEAFDWHKPFSRGAIDVRSMRRQGPAHRIYDRFGVRPTYLVDYPVATQEDGYAPLRELIQDGLCDVGAQLHPWVNPPLEEPVSEWMSYTGNLPLALQREKLLRLTEAIEEAFGQRPRIHRAGRYGAGARTAEMLIDLGYLVDSSTMPFWNYARGGGPDYTDASNWPHWCDAAHRLLAIPHSVGLVGRHAARLRPFARTLFSSGSERFGLPGALARLNVLERIKLTPEGMTIDEAKRLLVALHADGHRTFVLSYHTSSLQPGNTPYVRTEEDLARFLSWLDEVLDFFARELGGQFGTWQDVYAAASGRSIEAEPVAPPGLVAASAA